MSIFSEEVEPSPKSNHWFYLTLGLGAMMIIAAGLFLLNASGIISVSKLFQGEMKVEGEIFIVTQGRGNVKLGLVEVCAIPEKQILDWIDEKKTKAKIGMAKTQQLVSIAESEKRKADEEYQRAASMQERHFKAYLADVLSSSLSDEYYRLKDEALRKAKAVDEKASRLSKALAEHNVWSSPEYYQDGLRGCEAVSKTNSDGKFALTLKSGKYALAAKSDRKVFDDTEVYYWLIWVTPESLGSPLMLSNDNLMTSGNTMNVVTLSPNA